MKGVTKKHPLKYNYGCVITVDDHVMRKIIEDKRHLVNRCAMQYSLSYRKEAAMQKGKVFCFLFLFPR